ncbi:hypothetical protein SAMN06297387_109137 [Streptomyces zhaozhouensis]|uniref:Uncharacterized protein n=1 Tax=Streptomyces zhaozhouensis TaxID=1300267 RepID=A0A286DXB2_9ACTN|nr:hypothetical protein SAMN06297387_109137 [Streptomyces zhaozhouensis]
MSRLTRIRRPSCRDVRPAAPGRGRGPPAVSVDARHTPVTCRDTEENKPCLIPPLPATPTLAALPANLRGRAAPCAPGTGERAVPCVGPKPG